MIQFRRSFWGTVFDVLKYVVLTLASIVAVGPVVVCVFTAFKTEEEYTHGSVLELPKSFFYLGKRGGQRRGSHDDRFSL